MQRATEDPAPLHIRRLRAGSEPSPTLPHGLLRLDLPCPLPEEEDARRKAMKLERLIRATEREALLQEAALRGRPVGEEPWCRGGEVLLHVYHLAKLVKFTGLPIYHLGVEVYQCEHFFSADGILWCKPGTYDQAKHKKVLALGKTRLDALEVWGLVDVFSSDWDGSSYNLFHRNCQTFAAAFIPRLVPGATVPAQYCRFKEWGASPLRSGSASPA